MIDAAIEQRVELASGTALLAELQGVFPRDKFATQLAKRGVAVETVFGGYVALVVGVTPLITPRVVKRDPDDDHVIACAIAARADAIVSGDNDLGDIGSYHGIPIIGVREALGIIP